MLDVIGNCIKKASIKFKSCDVASADIAREKEEKN